MRLLAPQQTRELLQFAESEGFKKSDFELRKRDSHIGRGQLVNSLHYKDSEYYFAFEYRILRRPMGFAEKCVEFSPGSNGLVEVIGTSSGWQSELSCFVRWLKILKEELTCQTEDEFGAGAPAALMRLPNREDLFRDIDGRMKKHGLLGVLFIDLDGFKLVNDKFGHAEGDKCLEKVAEALGSIAVGRGRVYRYGGDEFVVVLLNNTCSEATATGERIRLDVERAFSAEIKVTASIGVVATDRCQASTAQELVAAADKCAYASKQAGRNRVTVGPAGSE